MSNFSYLVYFMVNLLFRPKYCLSIDIYWCIPLYNICTRNTPSVSKISLPLHSRGQQETGMKKRRRVYAYGVGKQEKGADILRISALRACQYLIFDFAPCSLPLKTLILLTFSMFAY